MQEDEAEGQPEGQQKLATEVAARRTELGLTQADLSVAAGVSLATVQAIEAGRAGKLRRRTALGIDKGLTWEPGSTLRVLRGGEPNPASNYSPRRRKQDDSEAFGHLSAVLRAPGSDPRPLFDALHQAEDRRKGSLERLYRRFIQYPPESISAAFDITDSELGLPPGTAERVSTQPMQLPELPEVVEKLMDLHVARRRPAPASPINQYLRDGEIRAEELEAISHADIPRANADRIVQHLVERRRQFNQQMMRDLDLMIELANRAPSDRVD